MSEVSVVLANDEPRKHGDDSTVAMPTRNAWPSFIKVPAKRMHKVYSQISTHRPFRSQTRTSSAGKRSPNSRYAMLVIFITVAVGVFPGAIHSVQVPLLEQAFDDFHDSRSFHCNGTTVRRNTTTSQSSVLLGIRASHFVFFVGNAIGAWVYIFVLQNFKHAKYNVYLLNAAHVIATILTSPVAFVTPGFTSFLIGRFVAGASFGAFSCLVPVAVADVAAGNSHPRCLALVPAARNLGCACAAVTSHPSLSGAACAWPYGAAIPGALTLLLGFVPALGRVNVARIIADERRAHESATTGSISEASDVMEETVSFRVHMRFRNGVDVDDHRREYAERVAEVDSRFVDARPATVWRHRPFRRQILVASAALLGAPHVGVAVVALSSLLRSDDRWKFEILVFYIGTCLLLPPVVVMATKIGARRCHLAGACALTVGYVLLSLMPTLAADHRTALTVSALCVVAMATACCDVTSRVIPIRITTEVARAVIFGSAEATRLTIGAVATVAFPYAFDVAGGYAFVPFIFLPLISGAYVAWKLPETRDQTSKEMQQQLRATSVVVPHTVASLPLPLHTTR